MSARQLPGAAASQPKGLPDRLPKGETLLWQGGPRARTLLVRAFHVRPIALYFGLLIAASAWTAMGHGAGGHGVGVVVLHRAALAGVMFALLGAYAWAIQRSTTYTITSQRVVMSFGMALPVSFNLPFSRIAAAGLRAYPDGSGDITLSLLAGERLSYFVLWPHARPWRLGRPEPMLRCVPGAQGVSAILAAALAEHAGTHAPSATPERRPVRMVTAPGRGAVARA